MARLCLHVLGPFQATLDGAPINGFASNKVRALLVFLAMESGRVHSRQVLAEMLWPEQPQRVAMDNLRYTLADLRRNIQDADARPPFLVISRDSLQFELSSDTWLDAADFERLAAARDPNPHQPSLPDLQAAAQLYRGGFLEGFGLRNSGRFEEWMLNRREQLDRTMISVLSTLADHSEQSGEIQPAMQYAWQLLELAPWQEEVHRQLMRLLAYDGQRSAALLQYETCRNTLARELAVVPSVQTTRLYESIRDGTLYQPVHYAGLGLPAGATPAQAPRTRFVAREAQLQQLNQCLETALAGQGQVRFITGEAGSGKTALVKEFLSRSLQNHPDLVAAYGNCNAFAGDVDPYLPFIEILRVLSGDIEAQWATGAVDRSQALHLWAALPAVVQALVEAGPALINRFIPGEALLARARALAHGQTSQLEVLVRRSSAARSESDPGSGRVRQSELFEQLSGVLAAVARSHPLVLVLDDLQWADRDTINPLFYLCRRLGGSRMLLVGICRLEDLAAEPEGILHPLLPALRELQTAYGDIQFDLSRADGRQFVEALLDSEPNALGEAFRATLEQHTGGIPLFTVELLRGMQDRGDLVQDADGRWIESSHLDWETLPPRVEAAIAECVGRLSSEWQSLLALASVEGDEFSAEVLAKVLECRPEALVQQLSGPLSKQHRIVQAAGLKRAGPAGKSLARYRFRHHLFQAYFYSRQDVVERARRHEAVGSALEMLYGDQTGEIAVPLARHFEAASLSDKAAVYCLRAGQSAIRLYAYDEAILHFKRGLSLITALPDAPERQRLELQLRLALAAPLIAVQGYTTPELEHAYLRARELAEHVSRGKDLFQVLSILKAFHNLRGDPVNSRATARRLLEIAEPNEDTSLLMTAHARMVSNCFYYGQWADLRRHLEQAIQFYDRAGHRTLVYTLGADPLGAALGSAALGFWIMGYPDQARRYCQDLLAQARELDHPMVAWFAHYYAFFFHVYARETVAAGQCVAEARRICDEQNLAHYRRYVECFGGWVRARHGEIEGLLELEDGIAWMKAIGDRMNLYSVLWLLADACLQHREFPRASAVVDEVLALAQDTAMVFLVPEWLRLKGEIALAQSSGNQAEAEGYFERAITSASAHGARMWEIRATVSLARLRQRQGRPEDAHDRLQAICSSFNEGFDTDDLCSAQRLLDGLAGRLPS